MSIDEKWLQGRIAKPGDYDGLPVEDLLRSLLATLGKETAGKNDGLNGVLRALLPPDEGRET